jgi:hypothetical protein
VAYLQANAEEIWLEVDSTAKRLALEDPREIEAMTVKELERLEHDTLDELSGVMYRAALLRTGMTDDEYLKKKNFSGAGKDSAVGASASA